MNAASTERMRPHVEDIMQAPVKSVHPEMTLADLVRWLLDNEVGGAPVVDQEGHTVGVVSRSDITRQVAVGLTLVEVTLDYYGEYSIYAPGDDAEAELSRAMDHLKAYRVGDAMSSRIISVSPRALVKEAAASLLEHGIHRLLVIDESGKLVGVVTSLDVVRLFLDGPS